MHCMHCAHQKMKHYDILWQIHDRYLAFNLAQNVHTNISYGVKCEKQKYIYDK